MKISFYYLACGLIILSNIKCKNQPADNLKNDPEIGYLRDSLVTQKIPNTNYSISIPKDYVIEEKEGVDFSVYHFHLNDSDHSSHFSGGLYFGNYPSEFPPDNEDCKVNKIKGELLNSNINWTIYKCSTVILLQSIVSTKINDGWDQKVHVFGGSLFEKDIRKLITIFSTLTRE